METRASGLFDVIAHIAHLRLHQRSFDPVVRSLVSQDHCSQAGSLAFWSKHLKRNLREAAGEVVFRSCRTTRVERTARAQTRLLVTMTNMNDLVGTSDRSRANNRHVRF